MIDIVTKENRHLYHEKLELMFYQRYQIFVKTLGWDLKCPNNREIDEYDSDETIYFLASVDENLTGSLRLIPTTEPHILSDNFACLCENGVPRGRHIWEASRAYSKPNGREPLVLNKTLGELFSAMLEYGLLNEIEHFTLVANLTILPAILHAGWDVDPLGIPKVINGERVGAFSINVTTAGLQGIRRIKGLRGQVTRYSPPYQVSDTKFHEIKEVESELSRKKH